MDNDAFSVFSSGFDFKADFMFGSPKGIFMGAQGTYSRDRIGLKDEVHNENVWGPSVELRTGYIFMFGREETVTGDFI